RARPLEPRARRPPRRACRTPPRAAPPATSNPHCRSLGIEFHLLEETKHGMAGSYPFLHSSQLVVGGLAERPLDREPGKVEVLLDHHRRDARVDLDHLLAHELDAEETLEPELFDHARGRFDELRHVDRDEVHAEAAAHRLPRTRGLEDDA